MGIRALGYVRIETAKPEAWDHLLTQVVGVMRAEPRREDVAAYRIDDRPFRFWVERGATDRLVAAGYEVADAATLAALKETIVGLGREVIDGDAQGAQERGVSAFFSTTDPSGTGSSSSGATAATTWRSSRRSASAAS